VFLSCHLKSASASRLSRGSECRAVGIAAAFGKHAIAPIRGRVQQNSPGPFVNTQHTFARRKLAEKVLCGSSDLEE